mmetsp:Transcript_20021/g.60511  ORF Transcript_20021/g.60511 Transcript_20021/m.60511 type:complete len:222 (-) Transcript_20021:82-747(-)
MHESRDVFLEKDINPEASGSVSWRQGGTEVLAAVHGPLPAKQRHAEADRAVVSVSIRQRSGQPGGEQRLHEAHVQHTVEACALLSAFPQSLVLIALQVVRADGGVLAACLNATCAALMDAGIPMSAPFAGVTCSVDAAGEAQLHPDAAAEAAAPAVLTATFSRPSVVEEEGAPSPLGLLSSQLDGVLSPHAFLDNLELCRTNVDSVVALQRQAIKGAFAVL